MGQKNPQAEMPGETAVSLVCCQTIKLNNCYKSCTYLMNAVNNFLSLLRAWPLHVVSILAQKVLVDARHTAKSRHRNVWLARADERSNICIIPNEFIILVDPPLRYIVK